MDIKELLLENLTDNQKIAVTSSKPKLLVVAGAGSGKTEIMARRIAWWVSTEGILKDQVVAFTFTERAAEEMKFRIRSWFERIASPSEEVSLGSMYIGTIHGFCLAKIREYWPDDYHNYDILNEGARAALILRGYNDLLGLKALEIASHSGRYATIKEFTAAYDQLHEHNTFIVDLPSDTIPQELGSDEKEWCKQSRLIVDVGDTPPARAFALSAARYYAYMRCRRFLDFSTSQTEFVNKLAGSPDKLNEVHEQGICLVVDELQDINPIQRQLIELLMGHKSKLTMVGDHRQSIYGFRGAKIDIIAEMWEQFQEQPDSQIVDLKENFRSTPRIIELSNRWADSIGKVRSMKTPPMEHGNPKRMDYHPSHLALVEFPVREQEAEWLADAIRIIVPPEAEGALHDKKDGSHRGLTLSDIAILVRSSTDVRTYMQALENANIPCVVRAGPDLFSQPEVLYFVAALALTAGNEEFLGSRISPKSLPKRAESVLGCTLSIDKYGCSVDVMQVFKLAAQLIRQTGLIFGRDVEDRVLMAGRAMADRIAFDKHLTSSEVSIFKTPALRKFLSSTNELRRVFPQKLFHMLLTEAEVEGWDNCEGRGQSALFHLGALSQLITGIETPGWTSATDYKWQIIGLCQYGAEEGRVEEQPLMVQPDAVSISTIHAAKGLEFAAVFLADVNSQRFPSSNSRKKVKLPLDGQITKDIDIDSLADNANHDGERRLMYVAISRSERFLFISHSGNKASCFIKELRDLVSQTGGIVTNDSNKLLDELRYAPKEHQRDVRLATSFSDLRYYFECPHDFYLRKVLGFSPAIDQAFGYGRGIHNLMRTIHSNPKKWALLSSNQTALKKEIQRLIDLGLFYLRYTTGKPAQNMRQKGIEIVSNYIVKYVQELRHLTFEPEKPFETLIEYGDDSGGALISGAIDIVRQDDPPRVTLIDFKSGDPESDMHQKLDHEEMELQVALYAVAAKKELEYQPEKGLVRYLDAKDQSKAEMSIDLDANALNKAEEKVRNAAKRILVRDFKAGPVSITRCPHCDFGGFCGMESARASRKQNS